ncbi:hypothetical protein HBI79_087720 [Parastagonospora nodorum]|nr:hypothetical protein HBI79_087720 [Parastagonospora nodorum]
MAAFGHAALLTQLYHHTVLPRDVPEREDKNLYRAESELVTRLTDAVKSLVPHAPLDDLPCIDAVRLALTTCGSINVEGKIDKTLLIKALQQLEARQALILHVTGQNAALLIYRHASSDGSNFVVFEAYETSATCERVLASENALQWDFPGQALAIPYDIMAEDDFQQSLCTFLEQASIESIKQFAAVTYKACAPQPEIRDTPEPTLVTEALMAILEVNGSVHTTPLLRKRVRDTVSFDKAYKPWRRSAFYLTVRVAIQRHLYNLLGADAGRLYYKAVIAIFLMQLLNDGLYAISNDASHAILQKLGRRLAKLELDYDRGSETYKDLHRQIFRTLRPVMEKSIASATTCIEANWEAHKRRTARHIWKIEQYATVSDMTLTLPLSGQILNHAMYFRFSTAMTEIRSPADLLGHYESSTALKPFVAVMHRYLDIFAYEDCLANADLGDDLGDDPSDYDSCTSLARKIETYISKIGAAYSDYPEFLSRQLLKVLELWMAMDMYAVNCYPLLVDYHPGFDPAMLNVFQLATLEEFRRIRDVQLYISKRCRGCCRQGARTIFETPTKDCFAVRYYDESIDAASLLELRTEIEEDAEIELAAKEEEWQDKSAVHESKIREMAGLSCVYVTEVDEHGNERQVHKKGCRKHRLKWEAKQMMIEILEHPLPKSEPALKAVVFELMCPETFAAYRDATWSILSAFAFSHKAPLDATPEVDGAPPLRSYPGLESYANDIISRVTLASSTKSHLQSHYAKSGFPVTFRDICRSFGLKLDYYDSLAQVFTSSSDQPSFAHLFPLKIPPNSPFASFDEMFDKWPSSNRVLATQTRCPPEVNVHEYMAWQGLLLGTNLRWPSLLREMGSSNLSFSTESTWAAISRLVLQAGPASSDDALRDIHSALHDGKFCSQLLDQIDYRLEAIRKNWRESVQLDILITIMLKVLSCAPVNSIRSIVLQLLSKSREITQAWCASLRSTEHEHGAGPSIFATWAAVLCKRTFYPTLSAHDIPRELVIEFIIASITLQNCLAGSFDTLPYNLRNAVLRDLTSVHSIRARIGNVIRSEQPLLDSLRAFWPIPTDCEEHPITILHYEDSAWILMTLSTSVGVQHHVHYNFVEGTLLINGQALGILPAEYRRWPIIQELFGSQGLRMFPSSLPGMSLVVDRLMPCGHWVHLGFRNKQLVIRATLRGSATNRQTVLELISRNIFGDRFHFDLPATLVIDCYHWLDLNTGIIEIRQLDPWKSKRGNWRLNLGTRQATRNNGSTLVDPNSDLAKKVMQNFHFFEFPHNITVYQPKRGRVRVELKRLELDFVVNHVGLLQCPQLGAVITETPLQDVGTWYGLKSKLVVRSIKDPTQRSILIPLGEQTIEREGPHVSIVVRNKGSYLKFNVNNVLGRIDCPAEPVMLYYRALWHAMTTYVVPDTLTKRTGIEEALQYLQSGAYQPWTPLSSSACDVLHTISALSPSRAYYPSTLKAMETVRWRSELTVVIQDDRYRRVVATILARNMELARFSPTAHCCEAPLCADGNSHLENRSILRNTTNGSKHDTVYKARDRPLYGRERSNAMDMASLLFKWPVQVPNTNDLASLLEASPIISGYTRSFDKIQLTDILHTDVGLEWGALVKTALGLSRDHRFELTFLFSLLAFTPDANMDLLRAIVSFAIIPDMKDLSLPGAIVYSRFKFEELPDVDHLAALLKPAINSYVADESTSTGQSLMRQFDHDKEANGACKKIAKSILAQWPSKILDLDQVVTVKDSLLDREEALDLILHSWERLVDNFLFSLHIEELQLALSRHSVEACVLASQPIVLAEQRPSYYPFPMRGGGLPTIQDILEKNITQMHGLSMKPSVGPGPRILVDIPNGNANTPGRTMTSAPPNHAKGARKQFVPDHIRELSKIIGPFRASPSLIHRRYGDELDHSIEALAKHLAKPESTQEPFNPTKLSNDLFAARESVRIIHEQLRHAFSKGDSRAKWLSMVGLWPSMSPVTLLTELRTTSGVSFGAGVKAALVNFGVAITQYQRLLRLQDATQKERRQQVDDERSNPGHTNWSPFEMADWLLLEIESNIMIRPEQVDVALGTIAPASRQNSVLQLLMGKGKTSCILPMVALVLSNENLFRVILPRPLLLQSAQIMQAKLGGILNREVIHLPFSRRTPTGKPLMQAYCQLHSYIQKQKGVVLALPEHILSFKLSGLQRLCDGKVEEATMMIKAQAWLDRHARDVLDECDVSLAIRTQLIYPSGSQQTVDGHPLRWQTIQALLSLIVTYLNDLSKRYPHSIEVVKRTGFPLIYFLRPDVENHLTDQLVQSICTGQTEILPVRAYSTSSQQDIQKFISEPLLDVDVTTRVLEMFVEDRHLVNVVYHLRGLFVHRILMSTLKKRWNVQYGLHPSRDPIAVPYQAKGVPSPSAEWGHPDVAIILTCLSFYYDGLSLNQFKQAIEHLAKSDEPSIEYSLWVADGVPEGFKNYNAVNVEDVHQLRELHRHVKYRVSLLDFYLNSFVFPQHAKQFSRRLSASGSDLVVYDPNSPACRVSGFSGTNDTRHQLPMTIKQNDLPQLAHTNAEVLAYLLEERNRHYIRMVDVYNKRLNEDGFLRKLLNPYAKPNAQNGRPIVAERIRILIDAGAQILEHDNRSLAKAWLKEDHEAAAAVYFDEGHRARVVYGKGTDVPLVASPFAENLEDCLVYIDESHCRGTDLKLPPNARAAVTLGPHLTKDALVQAAMRLRLLGKTQSVTFFSPPEVHQSILDLRLAAQGGTQKSLSSADVIRWLFEQTCTGIEQLEPLYFNQALNYLQRTQARLEHSDFLEDPESREAYLAVVRSKELQSLEQLYEPRHQHRGPTIKTSDFAPCLRTFVGEVLKRRKGFQDRGFAVHSSALEEVEQEREMEFEVEAVREVQPPIHFKALKTTRLHRDIEELALTGQMPAGSDAFQPMFYALQKTAVGLRHGTIAAASRATRLFVSTQFIRTVSVNEPNDGFLRPCHWLLWCCTSEIGLLVSPEEADALIPILRHVSEPFCHIIVYSPPITRRMLQFGGLSYYAIPSLPATFKAPLWLKVELGIFAGRLYFDWDECEEITLYLGIQSELGDVHFSHRETFATKPSAFLHEWLAIRRRGQDFEHTPMGYITTGKPLSEDHPFFRTSTNDKNTDTDFDISRTQVTPVEEEDDDDESDDGNDHAKEHLFQTSMDDGDSDVFHDAVEAVEENGESTFFKGKAYVDAEDEVEK